MLEGSRLALREEADEQANVAVVTPSPTARAAENKKFHGNVSIVGHRIPVCGPVRRCDGRREPVGRDA
jgi:hypothetical protein